MINVVLHDLPLLTTLASGSTFGPMVPQSTKISFQFFNTGLPGLPEATLQSFFTYMVSSIFIMKLFAL